MKNQPHKKQVDYTLKNCKINQLGKGLSILPKLFCSLFLATFNIEISNEIQAFALKSYFYP